ncbi:hypothetical protein Cob_v010458 [Colletotrichum orbiculare MAFF 240422]|uniref:Formylmethionine deformylase-like protein n=1 Tax=Colletotrichum orbiculare (strain 104-T / ATCC 96160 / CBS 514.97 / LARS 414 / MAFF 240422) TaxID=1213857 RepID=N4UWZ3_COLOR|nr:hypothetical protein Cob_v010458 [Colletotrichum orbiculare MAFF 240422]
MADPDRPQGLGVRQNSPEIQMTDSTDWQPTRRLSRKPVNTPVTPATPAPVGSPYGPHGRSPPTPSVKSEPSFSERAGEAAYFPGQTTGSHEPRPRPAPIQLESYQYSNYTPSQSGLGTPYGLPPKKQVRVDSHSALLSSPPWQQPPPNRQQSYTYHPPGHIAAYNKYWHPSWNMYFFLFAGIAFALGHHFFYSSLDGAEVTNQLRMLRYGAALSFLSKASLGSAVILAFRQRVWMTVRRKVLTLAAVDSLFAAAEDMSAIFNFEVFKQARVAMVLALYVWCTPLVVILTSDTLAVQPMTKVENTTCPSVRTLNFSHEETNDFRTGQRINNLFELSVSLWNTTSADTSAAHFFDYWTGTSTQFDEVATSAVYQKKPLERSGAGVEICGMGWNCTYTINFTGPGYKCTELASGVNSKPKQLNGATVPFPMEMLAPTGNHTYIAHASLGEYSNPQINDTGDAGIPARAPDLPEHLGALRTEPVLWFGYAHVDDPSVPQPANSSAPGWDTAYTPKIFACEHYETEYQVLFNYTNSVQKTTVESRTFVSPVVDTRFLPDEPANDGTMDNTTATPESNYILPTDVARYRRSMAYHSIGSRLRNFVNGTIFEPNKNANTRAIQTRLIDQHNYLGVNNLIDEVQSFYEDIILSMFTNPRFLAVAWASAPDEVTGTSVGHDKRYPCTRERTDNRYRYHAADLWSVYSVAIFLAIIGVSFGVAAVREEGLVRNTRFSSIVAATRGPGLEKLPWGNTVPGSDHRPVAGAKVGYGLVPTDPHAGRGAETYGFGLEGDVQQRREEPSRTPTGLNSPFSRASRRWSKLTQPPAPPPNV